MSPRAASAISVRLISLGFRSGATIAIYGQLIERRQHVGNLLQASKPTSYIPRTREKHKVARDLSTRAPVRNGERQNSRSHRTPRL
jgi:hypothetical protein